MIDFSAIEEEIVAKIKTIENLKIKSVSTSLIRENVALTEMPALDISAPGHDYDSLDKEAQYHVPIYCVIRKDGVDREENAKEFKVLIEDICKKFEKSKGTSYRVVRGIKSNIDKETGNGGLIRIGVLNFTVLI